MGKEWHACAERQDRTGDLRISRLRDYETDALTNWASPANWRQSQILQQYEYF